MTQGMKITDYTRFLSILLVVSIILNIYVVFKLNNYKYKLGQESYTKIEDFKQRNESNMDILSKGIEENSLKNEDLVKLYKNYDEMSNDIIELWQQYRAYTQNAIPFFSKVIKTDKIMENNINEKIKEYMLSTVSKEMKNESNKIRLESEDLQSFKYMYEISSKTYEYFNEFNEENLNGATGEDKESKVIKNHYWIDLLEGIYKISDDYGNVQWKIESVDSTNK